MSTVRTNTVSRIRTPNRRPLHRPLTVPRRLDIPGVAVEACSAASTTVDRRLDDPVATRGSHPVASNWRADDPVAALLRSAALFWGHDLLTHPFLHFDANFLHPAARIRAFSSCSWKGKKFSVIEAKLGSFFSGGEFESFRVKNFPFGRETLLPPVDKLVFLFSFFFYFKTCFDSPFDLIFFSPPARNGRSLCGDFEAYR
jgi:hypothetical protein